MLAPEKHDPRSPEDRRMYLYFNYSASGSLRWYVKFSRKGHRIGINEEYRTPQRSMPPMRPLLQRWEEYCVCVASRVR